MKNLSTLDAHGSGDDQWRVVIETPKGSCNKYKYDVEAGAFELARVLPEGLTFPFDFGFVPSTMGDDGDPLDVLLLMDAPTFSGCLVEVLLIGVIEARQKETDGKTERNDRILAVPVKARRFQALRSAKNLDQHMLREVERFFQTYNEEGGKGFKVLALHGPHRAEKLVQQGMKRFRRQRRAASRSKRPRR